MKNKVFVILTFVILASLSFTVFTENTFLVDVHAAINQTIFGVSGEEQVVVGRDGWLYFNEEMPAYFGRDVDGAAIDKLVETIARLDAALAEHDIKLVILIAPNKNSIYPEYMAFNYVKGEVSAARVINERLRGGERLGDGGRQIAAPTDAVVLDAFSVLLNNKDNVLYHRTDTHWNARGALLVYRELMAMLDVPHETYAGAEWETVSAIGDLTKLYRWAVRSAEEDLAPVVPRRYRSARPVVNLDTADIRTASQTNELRLLVVRDSFGESLFPYIANNIGSLTYLRAAPTDAELILSQDAVVLEIVERNVYGLTEICETIERALNPL